MVENKTKQAGKVRVMTVDAEAVAGQDYEKVDEVLSFEKGESLKFVEVSIHDDDSWEPDEDFFVQLVDPIDDSNLVG